MFTKSLDRDKLDSLLAGKNMVLFDYKAVNLLKAYMKGCGYELSIGGRQAKPFYKQEFIPNKKKP
jgi:hypothetical protein